MRRLLFATLLAAAALPSLAAPDGPEEPPRPYAEKADKGFMGRLGEVGHTVMDRADAVRVRASDLVLNAISFLGVPYRRGGQSAETGFDCSGFVRSIYEQSLGLVLPRRANEQAAATQVIDKAELQPGDLVFFNTMRKAFSHVGIYIGEGKFIHSPKPGAQVRVENMGANYWSMRFDGARRVAEGNGAAAQR